MSHEKTYKLNSFAFRSFNFAVSIVNFFIFTVYNILDKFKINKYLIEDERKTWNKISSGLFVSIHGLGGDISSFGHHLSDCVENLNWNYDIILPKVIFGGNCKLDIASERILNLILDYINYHPKKPIYIFATSNGSRIASYIEVNLRHLDVDIYIFSFAGVYGGTRNFDNLKYLVSLFYDKNIVEDLSLNSETNKLLKQRMDEEFKIGTRHYEFFAAANDLHIPNIDDCFPELTEKNNMFVKYHPLQIEYEHIAIARFNIAKIITKDRFCTNIINSSENKG